ncbi:MAG: hypothetical protein LBH57_07395, partial [Treponema sp.]|nr:hypothetical protein [Treponema sp.]
MKSPRLLLLVLFACIFIPLLAGCFSALPLEEEGEPETGRTETEDFESAYAALRAYTPSRREERQPLILVHYMPWYRG